MKTGARSTSRRRSERLLVGAGWGLADQALISAANFATLVILARALPPADFGVFVLAYTALLLLNGLQSALITQPHNVLGQSKLALGSYVEYTAATGGGQAVFAGVLTTLALGAAVALLPFTASTAAVVAAFAAALLAWQFQEFFRRVLYTEGRLRVAFGIDVLSYGGQAAAIGGIALASAASAWAGLLVVATSSAVSALIGLLVTSPRRWRLNSEILKENWYFGRWLGAAIAASWLVAPLYLYLAAIVLGAPAAGVLRAAQTVLGPIGAFLLFLGTLLPIRLAAIKEHGGIAALRAARRRAYLLTAPLVLLSCGLVAAFPTPILRVFYGSRYVDEARLVGLLALYYVVLHLVFVLTASLTAQRRTRTLFLGSALGGAFGLVAGWPLLAVFGIEGAALGMVASTLLVALVLWYADRSGSPDSHAETLDHDGSAPATESNSWVARTGA